MLRTGLELDVLVEVVEPESAAIDVAVRNRIDRVGPRPVRVVHVHSSVCSEIESSGGLYTAALAINAPPTFKEKPYANFK
jgi:hypothetical protein